LLSGDKSGEVMHVWNRIDVDEIYIRDCVSLGG